MGAAGGPAPGTFRFAGLSLEEFDARWLEAEAAYLRHLVREAGGNISGAARLAQVKNSNTLVARLQSHGIGR
jgi:DNA-binding NtrC family response regulator